MTNHAKTFGQVEETGKGEFLAVNGGEDVVGYGEESGFSGLWERNPCWEEENRLLLDK